MELERLGMRGVAVCSRFKACTEMKAWIVRSRGLWLAGVLYVL